MAQATLQCVRSAGGAPRERDDGPMRVGGRTWVVTGGGNGMGRELVLELLRRGARVAAVDLSAESLAGTVDLAGAFTDPDHVRRGVVRRVGARIDAGHGVLVRQHQRLV